MLRERIRNSSRGFGFVTDDEAKEQVEAVEDSVLRLDGGYRRVSLWGWYYAALPWVKDDGDRSHG
jgi:hypothetical protein